MEYIIEVTLHCYLENKFIESHCICVFPELFKLSILIQQYVHSTLSNLTKYPDNQILLFLKFPFKR
jgi:hypothetical protein